MIEPKTGAGPVNLIADIARDVIFILAAAMVAYGVHLFWAPAGWTLAGIGVMYACYVTVKPDGEPAIERPSMSAVAQPAAAKPAINHLYEPPTGRPIRFQTDTGSGEDQFIPRARVGVDQPFTSTRDVRRARNMGDQYEPSVERTERHVAEQGTPGPPPGDLPAIELPETVPGIARFVSQAPKGGAVQ